MAETSSQRQEALRLKRREDLLPLVYASDGWDGLKGLRFTQDSPVLPDVWLAYADMPEHGALGLLINPYMGQRAGLVARELREITRRYRRAKQEADKARKAAAGAPQEAAEKETPAPVAHLPGLVAAKLRFDDLVCVALPSTIWWDKRIRAVAEELKVGRKTLVPDGLMTHQDKVAGWLDEPKSIGGDFEGRRMRREFLALMRLVVRIREHQTEKGAVFSRKKPLAGALIVERFCALFRDWKEAPTAALIWSVALDREANVAAEPDSTLSIKADAGRLLFNISCASIAWAVIDSGIDVASPAFRDWGFVPPAPEGIDEEEAEKLKEPDAPVLQSLWMEEPRRVWSGDAEIGSAPGKRRVLRTGENAKNNAGRGWPTRIVERYDFTDMKRILDLEVARAARLRLEEIGRIARRRLEKALAAPDSAPPPTFDESAFWTLSDRIARENSVGLFRLCEAAERFAALPNEEPKALEARALRLGLLARRVRQPQPKPSPEGAEEEDEDVVKALCAGRAKKSLSICLRLLERLRRRADAREDDDEPDQEGDPPRDEIELNRLLALQGRAESAADWMSRFTLRIMETACVKIGDAERQEIARETIARRLAPKEPKAAKRANLDPEWYKALRDANQAVFSDAAKVERLKSMTLWAFLIRGALRAEKQMRSLFDRVQLGLELDWSTLDELLIDATPDAPGIAHGTQVAGVLAADWREPTRRRRKPEDPPPSSEDYASRLRGVCPDIRLFDLRVSDKGGKAQEFEAIAALQFIMHLNARSPEKRIHGANISLSIEHELSSYGCGKTPICLACEQVVASGVVVVAPAGNGGSVLYETAGGARLQAYQSGSITDPGNAETVITVGATHAVKPHQYGVSYFSSRGPTGDGRMKPDLVAPGEKIATSGLYGEISVVDGTSFAAPHASGAAALIMARHSEMIGRPQAIKEALMRSATDLGRERAFQGAGMLDALRALQAL